MYCHFTLVLLLGIHNTNVKQSSFKVLQKSTQFPVPLWIWFTVVKYCGLLRRVISKNMRGLLTICLFSLSACCHITCGHLHAKCEAPDRSVIQSNEVTQDYSRYISNHTCIENKTKKAVSKGKLNWKILIEEKSRNNFTPYFSVEAL